MFNIVFSKIVFWSYAAIQVQARKELGLTASWSCHQRVTLMSVMMTLIDLTKASLLFIPLPIHFWPWEIYQLLGEPLKPGGSEGPGSSPWTPCEFLCRKLIRRAGFSRSSQRKSVWPDVWIPKSWSKFSWSLRIDICSDLASRHELQPKWIQSEFPQEA